MTPVLQAAIEEFRGKHARWGSQDSAYGMCYGASEDFIFFLLKLESPIRARCVWIEMRPHDGNTIKMESYGRWPHLYMNACPEVYLTGLNETGLARSGWHCICMVEDNGLDVFIDWTARQYAKDAPYPLVFNKPALRPAFFYGEFKWLKDRAII